MATADILAQNPSVKMLVIGASGTGKTGALESLVLAGYKLRILDYDAGVGPLISALKKALHGPALQEALKRVDVVTLIDPIKDGKPTQAIAWSRTLSLVKGQDEWKAYGDITTWDQDTILVVDSLTFQGDRIMNFTLAMNNRLGARSGAPKGMGKEIHHWGQAMEEQEAFLASLYDDRVKCHIIVTSHITTVEHEDTVIMGYPSALGSKLPPKVPRYFNTQLLAKLNGRGPGVQRVISTVGDSLTPGKCEAFGLPPELPLRTGLRDVFKAIRGKEPIDAAKPTLGFVKPAPAPATMSTQPKQGSIQ